MPDVDETASEPVGLIGLGLLGAAIAERLAETGRSVVAYDVAAPRRESLAASGIVIADSSRDVVRHCDHVIFCLPHSGVVSQVLDELELGLRTGQIFIDTTTGDPEEMVGLATRLARAGAHYLEANVAGSSVQARAGEVTVFVGGDAALLEQVRELLAAFAVRIFHIGPHGSGARFKLVHNLILGLNRAVLAEGLTFAEAMGIDPAAALEILRQTPAYSTVMDTKGSKMVSRDFTPQARLSQHLKDVRLMLAEGSRTGAVLPLTSLHASLLAALEEAGDGGLDNSAIIKAFARETPNG